MLSNTKPPTSQAARRRDVMRVGTVLARALPMIQRKAGSCACGGSCPRCQEKSEAQTPPQTKLRVSQPGDALEQEADRIAETLTRGAHASVAPAKANDVPAAQRQVSAGRVAADSTAADEAARGLGAGRPLDSASRDYFESHLGHDLSDVRLHTGAAAAQSANALGARAYTMGRNVVFGAGEYAPGPGGGQRLLAHELVHVVQQSAAPALLTPGAYSLRIVDEQGGEKILRPPVPEITGAPPPPDSAPAGVPMQDDESIPVQRTAKNGAASTVFIQRAATFTKPVPKPDDPLLRVMKGLTPGLTTVEINGSRPKSDADLRTILSPSKVKQTSAGAGSVSCQVDGFDVATTAEQIVTTAAPAGGWSATVGPASAISGEAKCAKVAKIPITLNAKPNNADFVKLVQKSEDEHVADLKWLHDRYLVPYDALINGLRGTGADLNACGQDLVSKIGFHPLATATEFVHGWATSVEKLDGAGGTHTDNAKIATNADCSAATMTVDKPTPAKAGSAAGNVVPVKPTVTTFNPTTLKAVGKELKDGKTVVKKFSNVADATSALAVIQHYGMTSRNVIGPFEYFLVGKAAPSGVLKGANEFAITPSDHQVVFDFPTAGEWSIIETSPNAKGLSVTQIASFGKKRNEAYSAWQVLSSFGFTQRAWVGGTRQAPEMMYFRT